jgi:hypothetical protein
MILNQYSVLEPPLSFITPTTQLYFLSLLRNTLGTSEYALAEKCYRNDHLKDIKLDKGPVNNVLSGLVS